MDVLREREVKDNLERQLLDEQKMRGKPNFFVTSQMRVNYILMLSKNFRKKTPRIYRSISISMKS